MDKIEIIINKNDSGLTIKEFLKKNHIGRGRVEFLRVNKLTFINNEYKPLETALNEGDTFKIEFKEQIDFVPENFPLDVIYEDDYLIAVNKPSNLIIHPDDKNKTGTLVNRVANYYKNHNINRNVRYVHRIDKDTTGVVLFAKDFFTEAILLQDIENNNISREYIGITEGNFSRDSGVIDVPIANFGSHGQEMSVSKKGKPSKTGFKVIKKLNKYDEVLFTLFTGRTHQIRVHSSYVHHPILGDLMYGNVSNKISRMALHCFKLSFIHPISKAKIEIEAPIPSDISKLIN